MPDTPPTDNVIEIKNSDTILTKIPDQIIAENREGPYITQVFSNFKPPDSNKIKALLSTYFKFYKTFTANNICINFVQTLRAEHSKIYLLLVKILTSFANETEISDTDKTEVYKLLNDIQEHHISYFNIFTSIGLYKEIKSTQSKFIEEQRILQQKREAIVDRFEEVYLKSGLSSYSKDFAALCAPETTAKKWWLCTLIASSVVFLVYFVINIFVLQQNSDLTFTNLLIYIPVTALFFLILTWLGRRYATCREQEITYKHLTTVLSTYQAFQANLDDTNKGLLILETARVVTAIPKPLAKESPSFDYSKVVDIMKILDKNK